jgi:hypothetical protein
MSPSSLNCECLLDEFRTKPILKKQSEADIEKEINFSFDKAKMVILEKHLVSRNLEIPVFSDILGRNALPAGYQHIDCYLVVETKTSETILLHRQRD